MRLLAVAAIAALAVAAPALAQADDDTASWPRWDSRTLGLHVKHPAGAKIAVHGDTVIITGSGFAAVTIVVSATELHGLSSSGGINDGKVRYEVGVPLRAAECTAASTDDDQLQIAAWICRSVALDPAPRHPHVLLTVTSTGLADDAAFERAVRAKQRAVDACWLHALAKDAELPEGSMTLRRSYDHGAPAATDLHLEDFFDHDAKPLGACVSGVLKAVAAHATGDAAETTVKAICLYY